MHTFNAWVAHGSPPLCGSLMQVSPQPSTQPRSPGMPAWPTVTCAHTAKAVPPKPPHCILLTQACQRLPSACLPRLCGPRVQAKPQPCPSQLAPLYLWPPCPVAPSHAGSPVLLDPQHNSSQPPCSPCPPHLACTSTLNNPQPWPNPTAPPVLPSPSQWVLRARQPSTLLTLSPGLTQQPCPCHLKHALLVRASMQRSLMRVSPDVS